jgi:uncharacterized membrane protein YcaP (DUF421 family)
MEIVVRTAVVFSCLFVLLRAMGKRELAELTPFELLMLIVIGDLVQPGIMQEDMSITGSLLAVGTVACCVLVLSYADFRWPSIRVVLEGRPVIVARDGHVRRDVLDIERVPLDELLAAAREHGIADLRDVEIAVLEADGQFSFIARRANPPARRNRL